MANNERYIMNLGKCLGSGVTANVYLGIKSSDGSLCAMKCSNSFRSNYALRKEIIIMKDINHENIVKFYDNLADYTCQKRTFGQVIVMEYCNRNSLYEFAGLHKGLCDNMFLRVLECLNHGLYYLRGKDLIHRDIKPGNMMVHEDNMGYFHVKLCDLGTAKDMHSEKTFQTMCGTQEYLHPDMLIEDLEEKIDSFTINVDLWSTGITLYHGVTSQLPFVPINYSRLNLNSRNMLKHMYLNKAEGVISAIQNSANQEDITWSNRLPDQCRLSPMLNDIASKLIGHLLDLSEENNYERFFDEADSIASKKRILVFNSSNGELLVLYLADLTYDTVVENISKSVGHPRENLILLTRNKVLGPLYGPRDECVRSMPVKGHLRYTLTDDTVLVVVNKVQDRVEPLKTSVISTDSCKRPEDKYERYYMAKKYTQDVLSAIYTIGYKANYIDCQLDCYVATMFAFNQYILNDKLILMHASSQWQLKFSRNVSSTLISLVDLAENVISDIKEHTEACSGFLVSREYVKQSETSCGDYETNINAFFKRVVVNREMFLFTKKKFYDISDAVTNDNLDVLVHLAEDLVNEMLIIPQSKIYEDDDTYKLEVWQRQIRLFKHLELGNERLIAKCNRVDVAGNYFIQVWKTGINLMNKINSWEEKSKIIESERSEIFKTFTDIIDWWKSKAASPTEKNDLKTRILEIRDLVNEMMKMNSRHQ